MGDNRKEVNVDVELQWKDLKWSLELLRHNEDFTRETDRDWFQLNPTDIVLLACEAMGKAGKAMKALPSRVVLGFDDISCYLQLRPRVFRRLLDVLLRTLSGNTASTPSTVVNRFLAGLLNLVIATQGQLRMYHVLVRRRLVRMQEQLSDVMNNHNPDGSTTTRAFKEFFRNTRDLQHWQASGMETSCGSLFQLLSAGLSECGATAGSVDNARWQLYESCAYVSTTLSIDYPATAELLADIGLRKYFSTLPQWVPGLAMEQVDDIVGSMLDIVVYIALQHACLADARGDGPSSMGGPPVTVDVLDGTTAAGVGADGIVAVSSGDDGGEHGVPSVRSAEQANADDDVSSPAEPGKDVAGERSAASPSDRCAHLLDHLMDSVTGVVAKHFPSVGDQYPVQVALLDLCYVMLASKDFADSFVELTRFLQQQFEMLVIYATEGYLTQRPLSFLEKLLDFVMTSVENGRAVDAVLTSDLPNAFGHVFGIRHSEVSALVIEFVTLSLCSRHQNDLLKSGLESILAAYRLIKTDIQKRGEQLRDVKRVEAARVVHTILCDVLERVDEQCVTNSEPPPGDGDAQPPGCVYQWQPSILDAPTEIECTTGEEGVTRMDVLAEMLRLACAMVARGENMVYLFKTIVPKLIQEVPSTMSVVRQAKLARFFGDRVPDVNLTIPWQGDRKTFLYELFSVAAEYKRCTDLSVFHLCSIAVPRFAAGLSHVSALDDQKKLEVTTAILSTIKTTFRSSPSHMSGFIAHGFEIIANLVRPSAQVKDVLDLARKITRIFIANSRTSAVMVARQCMAFLLEKFPGEDESIRLLISTLFEVNSLQHLRALHRLCRTEFTDEWYSDARHLLYALVAGQPPALRDFLWVTEILLLLMDLCPTRRLHSTLSTATGEDSSPADSHGRLARRNRRLRVLTADVMKDMLEKVPHGAEEEQQKLWKKDVATIGLYAILCPEVLEREPASSEEEDTAQIRSEMATFPWRVFADSQSFATLQSFTVRLEHMQVPRYGALRSLLLSILHQYVDRARVCEDAQQWRRAMSDAVDALPQNIAIKAKLVQCGYSASLWTELDQAVEPIVTVTTSGTLSHEENLRQNLLRCYEEYGEILQQLHATHVEVDGDQVKVVDLFDDRLSLEQLRGRRAVACRCIDQTLDKSVHENLATRKVSLLTREERLEVECEEMVKKAEVSPKDFQVVLHTSLFHTARACGGGIIGCYAPTGEHCERPLEIGLRADQALASIYHDGLEIENVELVFCEEGAVVYKAYSNGHPYDTSEVWVKFFEVLLSSEQIAVPALIVQPGCPNTQTWLVLNRLVEPATTGFHINGSYDFTSEWRTYLDSRPERVRGGVDIVLTLSFCRPVRQGDRTLRRLASMQKDLAGLIFTDLMARLADDEHYKQFRFLGRSLAQCVGDLVACKDETPEQIISGAFKYDVYQQKMRRDGTETIQEKDEIVESLAQLVRQHTADYCASIGVASLFEASRGNFFDLKHYLYQMRSAKTTLIDAEALKSQTDAIHNALDEHTLLVGIDTLSAADQEELMRWIFVNEDRVWRYRGGRDRNETLHQFFHFLPHRREDVATQPCYPGVLVLSLRSKRAADWSADLFCVEDVVAYAIGEFVELDFGALGYEIVTAYVQPRFRGLKLAVRMYVTAVMESNCSYLMCDMLEGSLESVVTSNPILVAVQHLGLLRYAIRKRELSYEVVDQTGCKEQFEKIVVNARYLRQCRRAHGALCWAQEHPLTSASLLMMPTLALASVYAGFQFLRRRY